MSKQELTSLLQKYFSKEITPAEKQALTLLIAQSADEEQLKASVEDLWNQYEAKEQLTAMASDAYYQRILQQIKPASVAQASAIASEQTHQTLAEQSVRAIQDAAAIKAIPAIHRVHFLRRSWTRIAAAAVIVLTMGGVLYLLLRGDGLQHAVAGTHANRPLTRNILLPDGSKVILQANSTLDYPGTFTGDTREVTLTGEAYFDVAHNAKQAFIIHAGKIKTTVLGTAFNIKAWPAEEEVTVTVTRGKVRVEDETHVLGIITPDQQISFNKRNEQAKQAIVDAADEASWKDKEYSFNEVNFDEAITEIQMRYGIIIELSNSEKAQLCPFTASFKQGESLEYVLNVISKLYNATWHKEEGRIVIDNVHCNNNP